ncbi:MAG TPA: alkyl sulfatase dimerization domain-containing protein [Nitrolancea sp.]|nr:alkyl sulfatase dimerization domain-containing protein [Nitrolancea sp.]
MPIPRPLFLTGQNDAYTDAAETVPAKLTAHARTMAQGVYQIAEQFYVAVGYGQSNMTMVVGTDGVILIDCLETEEHARQALADLRQVSGSGQPVKALVYSHSHPDHISGVRALLDPAAIERGQVQIYAHERLPHVIRGNPSLGLVPPLRLAYTFGLGTTGFLPPTTLFQGSLNATVAGLTFQLHEAPSESDDEIVVWFPDQRVLFVADVIQGESLPNLYALRGAVRNPLEWVRALDLLRTYDAEALIFGHGRPLIGLGEIQDLLVKYRDALQYIHDQAVRLMARGLTPDELIEALGELPPRLREHPWLGEFYGTVKQTVPQIYANYYGWFEGDPTFIDRLPRREQAARYVAAMGGRDPVVAVAEHAYAEGDYQWVAEILTHLLRVDSEDQDARRLKAQALRRLGYLTSNPIWRNNYLMGAREIDGTLDRDRLLKTVRAMGNPDIAAAMPIPLLLRAFATRLNPSRSDGSFLQVAFRCTDSGADYGLAIRSEVAEVLPVAAPHSTIVVETTEPTLRGLLTGRLPWPRAVEEGAATLEAGTPEEATRFWSLFDSPLGQLPNLALR